MNSPSLTFATAQVRIRRPVAKELGAKPKIFVAPYFLFDGGLSQRVVEQARAYARAAADIEVRVIGDLGDCVMRSSTSLSSDTTRPCTAISA